MDGWSRFLDVFFKPELIERYFPAIMKGVVVTVEVAAAVVVTGLALGLVLAILRSFRVLPLSALIVVFADMFRALPPLVLVLLVYFGLPNVGISLPSFTVLWLVLALVLAAFAEEIFWAGILSIPKGQWEAARSTGLNFLATLTYVVLPQALRLTVPPITNRTVAITKNPAIMERALPLVLTGFKQTLLLCLLVIPLGLAGGLAVAPLSLSRRRAVRWIAAIGIDFFRAVPPLVLLIFVYSGLPFAGFRPT